MSLADDLQTLGFSDIEAKTYEILVAFGFRTPGQVAAYLEGASLDQVRSALNNLEGKGYVKSIATRGEESRIYIPEAPKIVLGADVSDRLAKRLGEIGNKVNEIWKQGESQLIKFKDEFQKSKLDATEQFVDQITEFTATEKQAFDELAEKEKESMDEISANLAKNVKNAVIPPIEKVADKLNEESSLILSSKDQALSKIDEMVTEHHGKLDLVTNEVKTEIVDYANELGMSVSARVTVVDQAIGQMAEQNKSTIEERRVTGTTQLEELSNSIDKSLETFSTEHLTTMDESYRSNQELIKSKLEETNAVIDQSTKAIKDGMAQAEKEAIKVTQDAVQSVQGAVQKEVESIRTGLIKAIEDTQKSAVDGLTKILDQTKSELSNAHGTIENSLNQNKSTLDKDLDALNLQMEENLKEKFEEVQQNNISFKDQLSEASLNSVEHITKELTALQVFISQFLVDTKEELKAALDQINTDIDSTLGSIESESTAQREGFVNSAKTKAEQLSKTAEDRLQNFHDQITEFLNSLKNELIQSLNTDINQFEQSIAENFTSFEEKRKTFLSTQEELLTQFNNEAEKLQIDANSSKDKLVSSFSSTLRDVRDKSLGKFKEISSTSLTTFSNDMESLKMRSKEDIGKFKADFELNIVTIREELPQEIERMFSDHQDKLVNLQREFELYKSKSEKLLKELEEALENNTKGMFGKKDFVIQKLEEHRRMRADYEKMSNNLETLLVRATRDTESTQEEVLTSLGKTVQDEVEKVENLVNSQTSRIESAIGALSESVQQSHSSFLTNVTSTSEELLNEMEDKVKNELSLSFTGPLSSLIGKAQFLATGVDANSQENVIVRTQQELIDALKADYETLLSKTKEDIGHLTSKVETRVATSINETKEIKEEFLKTNLENINQQFEVMDSFSENMGDALSDVISKTKDELRTKSDQTINKLDETVKTRLEEIETGVQAETNNLKEDTNKRLEEISAKFDDFNSVLDQIREDTNAKLSDTLKGAKTVQEENLTTTLKVLADSFNKAEGAIDTSAKSMEENVNKPLLAIRKSAETLDKQFATVTKKEADKAAKNVQSIFKQPLSNAEAVIKASSETLAEFASFVDKIEEIRIQLNSTLKNNLETLKSTVGQFNSEVKSKLLNDFSSQIDELISFVDGTFAFVNSQVMDLQTEVNGAVSNVKGTTENLVLNAIEQVKNDVSNAAKILQSKIVEVAEQNATELKTYEDHLRNEIKSYENIVDDSLGKDMGAMNDRYKSHIEEVKGLIDQSSEKLKKAVKDFESTLNEKIESEIHKDRSAISETISNIPAIISETLDAAGKAINLLRQIAEGAQAFDPKMVETTYIDATKEALISDLNALIMRTKSNLTIVTPTIDWIDSRVWEEYGRKSVTIITDPTAHGPKDQEVMEKMRQSDNNIQFRKYQPKGFGAESLKMIIATRDGEEVLIGLPVNNKDVYGMVTQDPIFVEELGTLVSTYRAMPRW